jgi:hypothetical protein
MKDDTTICIATFSSEQEADMARMSLDSNGIYSFVSKDDFGGLIPWFQPITGVRLIVRESDAKQASEILLLLADSPKLVLSLPA